MRTPSRAAGRNDLWGGLLLAIGLVLGLTALAGVSLFQVAAAGFFTWLALARRHGWAWIPAAIFGFSVIGDLLDGVSGSLFLPLLVISGGVLLLAQDRLSRRATFGILVLLAVVGIASAGRDEPAPPGPPPREPAAVPAPPDEAADGVPLPALEGRELLVLTDSTPVALKVGGGRTARVFDEDAEFSVEEDGDLVTLSVRESDSVTIEIPREASVLVRSVSASVTADVVGFGLDVDTVTGKVDLEIGGRTPPPVRARTGSGEIEVSGFEDVDPAPEVFASAGGRGRPVEVRSRRGDIDIARD